MSLLNESEKQIPLQEKRMSDYFLLADGNRCH